MGRHAGDHSPRHQQDVTIGQSLGLLTYVHLQRVACLRNNVRGHGVRGALGFVRAVGARRAQRVRQANGLGEGKP